MAVQFNVPKGPAVNVWKCEYFKGVDLNNAASNVENYRSPEAPNMIRDEVGKVRKRMGFQTMETIEEAPGKAGRINGRYVLDGVELIHAGAVLKKKTAAKAAWETVYTEMADRRSVGLEIGRAHV